jgi:glyoxylase-like metal-dependent hydrolase (beta-lactamase superfamily II)
MIFKMMETGPLMVNTYIVADENSKEAGVFDPGGDSDKIMKALEEDDLKIKYLINTHAHFDHVGGNKQLQDITGAPIIIHGEEAPDLLSVGGKANMFGCSADDSEASEFVKEGDVIEVGSIQFKALDLRGHSPAGLGFLFEGEFELGDGRENRKAIICGDALFAGSIGRTDFPGGNLELLLENVRTRIFVLPDDTLVLSGHGPATTVGREKRYNPFFQGY